MKASAAFSSPYSQVVVFVGVVFPNKISRKKFGALAAKNAARTRMVLCAR